ncbi:MAG TPA: ATPase, T2SS/T4P/T4SS family, partial [Pirellulaceae bacterium]|nr:ATPase, T2SS/T4P/T4SS family [Pirellulaceae bacterium]
MAGKLGEILIRRGLLTNDQLQAALHDQGVSNALLGAILVGKGWITTEQLGRVLSEQFDAPFVELAPQSVNPQLVRLLPETFARERQVVPVQIRQRRLTLAMLTPDDIETISEAELITGYEVDPVIAMQAEIQATLDHSFDERLVARQTAVDMKLVELEQAGPAAALIADSKSPVSNKEEDAPVVRLTKAVLMGAINAKASDIHIEPHNPEMRVRYRIDGELQQVMTIPKGTEEAIIARLKVLANLDTTENRRPQDGRITVETDGKRVNFRTSCIPTTRGEKICMRLLDEGAKTFDIDTLGLTPRDRGRIQGMLDKPHGMIVVTGPTGSGKTTTMYAMLSKLNTIDLNITTVEDPVEYKLTGINQVQSDNDFGLGFANALKYILRQDPDVIMVGEIRDH